MDLSVIGIAGVASCGKDTFGQLLIERFSQEGIKARREAFADTLKEDLNNFLLAKTGVNAYTIDEGEKILLRPLMVEYGRLMRRLSAGNYWIDLLKEKIEKNTKKGTITIVTDVRYANEAAWINSYRDGLSVYIAREGIQPANEEELTNDKPTQEQCTHTLNWTNTTSKRSQRTQAHQYFNAQQLHTKFIRLSTNQQDKGRRGNRRLPA